MGDSVPANVNPADQAVGNKQSAKGNAGFKNKAASITFSAPAMESPGFAVQVSTNTATSNGTNVAATDANVAASFLYK